MINEDAEKSKEIDDFSSFQEPRKTTSKTFQHTDAFNEQLHRSISWQGAATSNSFTELSREPECLQKDEPVESQSKASTCTGPKCLKKEGPTDTQSKTSRCNGSKCLQKDWPIEVQSKASRCTRPKCLKKEGPIDTQSKASKQTREFVDLDADDDDEDHHPEKVL